MKIIEHKSICYVYEGKDLPKNIDKAIRHMKKARKQLHKENDYAGEYLGMPVWIKKDEQTIKKKNIK